MKRLLLCLLLPLMPCLTSLAQTTEVLKLWTKAGKEIIFRLDNHPKITFKNDLLQVQTAQETISFQLESLRKYTVEMADVSSIASVKTTPELAYSNGVLTLSRLSANAAIEIFSVDGKLVAKVFADADGNATADFAAEAHGIYIVKTPDVTFRIKK